jgi:hypothetical protein
MLSSKPVKRLVWVSSLDCFAFLEGLLKLVVRFHVPNAKKAGVWVSDLDSLLTSRCYRMFGSALPPKLRFQVSKTWFSHDSSALFAFFFSIRFQASLVSQDSKVLLRVSTLESTMFSASRTAKKLDCFAKSVLLGGIESLHVWNEQPRSI